MFFSLAVPSGQVHGRAWRSDVGHEPGSLRLAEQGTLRPFLARQVWTKTTNHHSPSSFAAAAAAAEDTASPPLVVVVADLESDHSPFW